MNGEMSVLGRVEFFRECSAGNCRYHNVFLPTSVVGREKQKDSFLQRNYRKQEARDIK